MNETCDHLMSFQEFLLDTLYTFNDVKIIQEKLEQYQNDPLLMNWIKFMSPHMLEVAARMTQHWGKRTPVTAS